MPDVCGWLPPQTIGRDPAALNPERLRSATRPGIQSIEDRCARKRAGEGADRHNALHRLMS
ncbi:MAG: hypothetical protein A2Z37_05335 [Chloroflexi bacterium RBG_19FT_COMBO_62_14]|nr:MAG: hypothetical protein A2Z37_05335 [Chloroflexi bacterium RBG_19FT_COMBO_62_14]